MWAQRARERSARERRTRLASSHQHAGQPHHTGVIHPLVAGSIPAPAGGCGVRGPKRSTAYYSASCRVKAWRKRQRAAAEPQAHAEAEARERTLRNPEYMALKSPQWGNVCRSGLCWTVAWRARTWERANPRLRPSPTPPGRRAVAMAARGWQQTRKTGPRSRHEPGDDRWPARNRPWCTLERRRPWFMADPWPGRACARSGPCYANTIAAEERDRRPSRRRRRWPAGRSRWCHGRSLWVGDGSQRHDGARRPLPAGPPPRLGRPSG